MRTDAPALRVAIAGFGSIGRLVGRHLDAGIPGLRLVAVSARNLERARDTIAAYRAPVAAVPLVRIADDTDVVVECTPPEVFGDAIGPAIDAGRIVVTVSAAALLERPDLEDRARATGARIVLVSGSVLGFDAIRAAAIGRIDTVKMTTRKPPASLARASWLRERGIDVLKIDAATKVFSGTAREAARAFPDKFNIAAAIALAGIGPDRTQVDVWLDPSVERNVHRIAVEADSTRFEMEIQNLPNPGHEGTGPLTGYSVLAALKDLVSTLRVGT